MKHSISTILILLLFSSPQDQRAEDPVDGIVEPRSFSTEYKISEETIIVDEPGLLHAPVEVEDEIIASTCSNKELLETVEDKKIGIQESVDQDFEPVPSYTVAISDTSDLMQDNKHQEVSGTELDESIPKHKDSESEPSSHQESKDEKVLTESNKSEDSIPSFSEWTKLQLAQRKESIINNIKNKSSLLEGKNFASPDCGAKVINSNPESQNPSGVISSSHDEYMLNRCTTNVWFILELCEPLTIERVGIGNLELFSSNPHEFELGVSDRYPTRDWNVIGPFDAPDSRNMHSFHLPTNDSTFGKYLRVIVKSHHGNEHYCPLSLIKVYGRSEYEVLESETTHGEDMEVPGIIEEEMNDDKPVQKSVIGAATAVVMDIVKKAADALVSKKVVEEEQPTTPSPLPNTNSSCVTISQCIHDSESKISILEALTCNSKKLKWMAEIVPWCEWEHCHSFLKANSIGSPWMPEALLIAIYGPTIIESICHYKNPIKICDPEEPKLDVVQLSGGVPNGTGNSNIDVSQLRIPTEGVLVGDPLGSESSGSETPSPPLNLNPPQQEQQPAATSFQFVQPPPPVDEPTQKESVFVRLSNRIKSLERNQSLSSGYLEELSQRFKKQNEEIHNSHEQFRRTLNESLTKCTLVEQNLRYEVRKLNRNIDSLRELISKVELQRSGLFLFSFIQLICTCIFWWTRKERRGQKMETTTSTTTLLRQQSYPNTSLPLAATQRKRSGYGEQQKQKKKKKRKEMTQVQLQSTLGMKVYENMENTPPLSGSAFTTKIPTSLSTGSIPLRLPPTVPFEFKSPPIFNPPRIPAPRNCIIVPLTMKPGISSSEDVSDASTGSCKTNDKKKSKFKSFLFGK